MNLCRTFLSLSFRTFDCIGTARKVSHQPLEETFTDINLLELKIRNPNEIICHTFTKYQEGKNGADWEWWLTDSSRSIWLGLRVQAKIINITTNNFEHLHYKSGKRKTYQLAKLKQSAKVDGLIPLYVLYLHANPGQIQPNSPCSWCCHTDQARGCSIASLTHIENLQKQKETKDIQSVTSKSVP